MEWKGMNCKAKDGVEHSLECQAEHAAAIAGGMFVRGAAFDIVRERRRQIDKGFTPEHDDEHVNDQIAAYAALYAMPEAARDWDASSTGYGDTLGEAMTPYRWYMPSFGDRRDQLVKAGALLLAEIERLDRAMHCQQSSGGHLRTDEKPLEPTMMYPAKFEQDGTGFVVTFRDVPEAITQGDDFYDAVEMAISALSTAHSMLTEAHRGLPSPSEPLPGEVNIPLVV